MRYILYRFKGLPTEQMPVGMNDIIGLGDYQNPKNAMRYLFENRLRSESERRFFEAMAQKGWSHFGLYAVPRDHGAPDVKVRTISNPWWELHKPKT